MDLLKACEKEIKEEPCYISILTGFVMILACVVICALIYIMG